MTMYDQEEDDGYFDSFMANVKQLLDWNAEGIDDEEDELFFT